MFNELKIIKSYKIKIIKISKISINKLITNPELYNEDNCYDFYDWFCKESSLKNRYKKFLPKLKFLVKQGVIDGDKNYVWFKNNCPMSGSLYDDMRISTIEDDEFVGGICPSSGHNSVAGEATVWTLLGELEEKQFNGWSDLKSKIKTDKELREFMSKAFC